MGALLGVSEEPENNSISGNSREILVDQPKGIKEGSSQKMKRLSSQMKCPITNKHGSTTSRRNWKLWYN